MMLQCPVKRCINAFRIIAQVAQVAANKGKLGLSRIHILYFTYTFHRFVLRNIATQPVNGIRWINDYPAAFEAIYHLLYQPWLRIFGMNMNEHV